jgi:hypothetical protein
MTKNMEIWVLYFLPISRLDQLHEMIVIKKNTKLATYRSFIVENLVQCKALGEFKNNNSHQEKNLSYASA